MKCANQDTHPQLQLEALRTVYEGLRFYFGSGTVKTLIDLQLIEVLLGIVEDYKWYHSRLVESALEIVLLMSHKNKRNKKQLFESGVSEVLIKYASRTVTQDNYDKAVVLKVLVELCDGANNDRSLERVEDILCFLIALLQHFEIR